jgi:RNA polymerase sigma-70 factor (ECF subfamily)
MAPNSTIIFAELHSRMISAAAVTFSARHLATAGDLVVDRLRSWMADNRRAVPAQTAPETVAAVSMDSMDLTASLTGDGDAFGRIVARHQSLITRQMWRFTRDRRVLEELVQDVFVEAYTSLAGFQGRGSFEGWLRRIAVRVGYRYWKQQGRQRRDAEAAVAAASLSARANEAEAGSASDAAEVVQALLCNLSARDRLVITLLYLDGCSVADAAKLSGWSQTMVKVQAFRARRKLQRLLRESK